MKFGSASKAQLIQITLFEDCPTDLKYAAVRELQRRRSRRAKGQMHQVWRSLHRAVLEDIECLRHKILQLRDEMRASGVSDSVARQFLDERTVFRINRRIQNTSAGIARKQVNRKAVQH
jgi:hypothetical protein